MFWKKEGVEAGLKKAVKDVTVINNNAGATRRATSMMPVAAAGSTHEIAYTSSVRFHQLLISLEGNQRTGCLRVISPKMKSRSGILIYRGRVLGCLWGCKKFDFQCLQREAHQQALVDLAQPGNILDAYELPEELVLSAASLFNGDILDVNQNQTPFEMFDQAVRSLGETRLPSCAIVNTLSGEMVCMVYVFAGKIIGVFSARDGWVKPTYEQAASYLNSSQPMKVMAAYLPVNNRDAAESIGFSLTGLGDVLPNKQNLPREQMQAVESFTTIQSEAKTYSQMEPKMVPTRTVQTHAQHQPRLHEVVSAIRSHNVFAITP